MFRRPVRTLALWAGVLLLLGLGERWLGSQAADRSPLGSAAWIWAPPLEDEQERDSRRRGRGRPRAFDLVRDFEVDQTGLATLAVWADAEYVVTLNGRLVGRGHSEQREAVDQYRVGRWLVEGTNRLSIEVRSASGEGGLIAGLWLEDEAPSVQTDGSWLVVASDEPGVAEGWTFPKSAVAASVFESPPAGRRGRLSWSEEVRSVESLGSRRVAPSRAIRVTSAPGALAKAGSLTRDGRLVRLPVIHRLDFDPPVDGYLELQGKPRPRGVTALRAEFEEGSTSSSVAWGPLVTMPGRHLWRGTTRRRSGRVDLLGFVRLDGAWIRSGVDAD